MNALKKSLIKLTSWLLIFGGLFIYSCEPDHCAWCYDSSVIHVDREIEICADDRAELEYLVERAVSMGYDCKYKD